jgi:hypothetical protein
MVIRYEPQDLLTASYEIVMQFTFKIANLYEDAMYYGV